MKLRAAGWLKSDKLPFSGERSEPVCPAMQAGHVGRRCQAAVKNCCDEQQLRSEATNRWEHFEVRSKLFFSTRGLAAQRTTHVQREAAPRRRSRRAWSAAEGPDRRSEAQTQPAGGAEAKPERSAAKRDKEKKSLRSARSATTERSKKRGRERSSGRGGPPRPTVVAGLRSDGPFFCGVVECVKPFD